MEDELRGEAPAGGGRGPSRAGDGALRSALAQAMTRIHAEHYGKGPTRAKAYVLGEVVVVIMRDVFTTVERTLIGVGKEAAVREVRYTFQHTLAPLFVSSVEELTGRRVESFLSQVDTVSDIAVEVFVLETEPA